MADVRAQRDGPLQGGDRDFGRPDLGQGGPDFVGQVRVGRRAGLRRLIQEQAGGGEVLAGEGGGGGFEEVGGGWVLRGRREKRGEVGAG